MRESADQYAFHLCELSGCSPEQLEINDPKVLEALAEKLRSNRKKSARKS